MVGSTSVEVAAKPRRGAGRRHFRCKGKDDCSTSDKKAVDENLRLFTLSIYSYSKPVIRFCTPLDLIGSTPFSIKKNESV